MRARFTFLVIPAAVAGCSPNEPVASTAPSATATGTATAVEARTSAAVFCANTHIYPLTENTWELAATSVNGHSLTGVASDGGTFDYSLDITPQIASDLQQSAIQGCAAEVRFVTGGEVGTVGNGQASFTAATHVKITGGGSNIGKTFKDGYTAPPQPAGCTLVVCIVPKERIVTFPATLQATFQPGGKVTVHSDATVHVAARGTSVWDQASAFFSIPHGSGRHPDGPLLIITFP